jgi:predicted O-methyltransferase YrrM
MFHNIPETILKRMQFLEELDAKERAEDIPPLQRLRQVPPETGKFLALSAANTPKGKWIEIGTSGGYSALWLSLACRATGRKLTTYELLEEKVKLAKQTFKETGTADVIDLVQGDARDFLSGIKDIAFCFLDCEKDMYQDCYDRVVPNLVRGGLLVADNTISHREALQSMLDNALKDERIDAMIVPVGNGELVCRKI